MSGSRPARIDKRPARDVLYHIEKLMDEEQQLKRLAEQEGLAEDQCVNLQQLDIYLDECWSLLRQRRARRMAGLDPADARLRDRDSIKYFPQ